MPNGQVIVRAGAAARPARFLSPTIKKDSADFRKRSDTDLSKIL